MPHVSFQLWSGYLNSASPMCAPREGKNIGTRGFYMSFEACERRNFTIFVPFEGLGIVGAVRPK